MSDDIETIRYDNLKRALSRAFPGLAQAEAEQLATELMAEKVKLGSEALTLERGFGNSDPALLTFLAGMGVWQVRLQDTIDDRTRSLRWAPEHQFLYVSRVA